MGCDDLPWNDPYPYEEAKANTLYSSFSERPKHLDPARSYTAAEWPIIGQIYEPPLQYHYLKRPYELEPLTAAELPIVSYYDEKGKQLPESAESSMIAYTDYIIKIKPGILYQPHPAFAKDEKGQYLYHNLTKAEIKKYKILSDFKALGTRELIAEDYVHQIKRLAEPSLSSPIFGLMSRYIIGLKALRARLKKEGQDLRQFDLEGALVLDRYTYRIRIKNKYPQFHFWLALPFFSPIPWEAALFYAQPGLEAHNISLDWYPVGTGPFNLEENNPNKRMVLKRNPNFREEQFPLTGQEQDKKSGILLDAGKKMPAIEKAIYTLEKETIPFWDKFLEGYYDMSGITSDNFNSAVRFNSTGLAEVTADLKAKGVRLQTSFTPSCFYWGFNMLDETVGGYTEKAKNLRKAISLVFNIDEFISIFFNGRGERAYGPIPPDIFGYEVQKKQKENLAEAKSLLNKAGFKENVTVNFDTIVSGDPEEIALHAWIKEQFEKLGINVVIRGSDYNRFQDKLRNGSIGMFFSGWNADYPDPENFLFLFYGPNSSVGSQGENSVNYKNPEYDVLFEKMRALPDGSLRLEVIRKMVHILQEDAPWVWGFYPKSFGLYHEWMRVGKPSGIINNTLKYARIDPDLRAKKRIEWNKPVRWPLYATLILLLISMLGFYLRLRQKEDEKVKRFGD